MPASIASFFSGPKQSRYWLAILLVTAIVLRLVLVKCGGQFFFGDEGRHERGVALYIGLRNADFSVVKATLARPEHIGFTLIGAGITGLQHIGAQFTSQRDWRHPENVIFTFAIGAGFLAMFSVLNIWFVYRIALCAGGEMAEAGWAALLMACSNTGFYYARHFLPYDMALSFALAAVWVGLNHRRSFLCGVLTGATYHCYNGYWYLVPVIVVLHLFWSDGETIRSCWTKFAGVSIGIMVVLATPLVIGYALVGRSYWETVIAFSDTVNQGLYREGWSLPWEYFWHSEGGLGVAVCLAIGVGLILALKSAGKVERRMWLWLAVALMSYCWVVLFSVGLGKFVVYARTVKPFVPFICLAGGWAVARLLHDRIRLVLPAVIACCLAAVIHFMPHFEMVFPAEVEQRVLRDIGNPKHSLSVAGSLYARLALPVNRPELVLVNAQLLYPIRSYRGYPFGKVIFSLPHPLSYPPFQYESHSPRERALLRENDISIKLIRVANSDSVPNDLPEPDRFTANDRPDGYR